MHTTTTPEHRDLTPDEWLAGYFNFVEGGADKKGAAGKIVTDASRKWKNLDFLRLRDVGLHLLEPTRGMQILDLGCANGATMIYCGLQGATVFGQDLDANAVRDANAQLKRFGIKGEAVVGDVMKLTFPDNHFDAVISSDFVEHITDEAKVVMLREARRVLKPGGHLVTKTPNLAYLKLALRYKQALAIARMQNPLHLAIAHTPGTADPQHIGLATRWSFTRCLTEAGFMSYQYHYAPLRRFGLSPLVEVLSTEVPVVRDVLCEDIFCKAYKPIAQSHFPD